MQRRRLGSAGPEVSVVGFGTWEAGGEAWGANSSEDEVIEAIRAGLDAGIDWVDTAEVYGDGTSEELVGRAVAGRDDILIATKVAPQPDGTGFRAAEVRRACEASLTRLGRNVIDLYQLHWRADDDDPPVEETWQAMASLVDDGLVRAIGVSNFDRALIERCEAIRHVDSLQPHFSLLVRHHAELIRWCGERGIGVVAYGALAFGLLSGAIDEDTEFDADDWRSGRNPASYYRKLFAPGKLEWSLAVTRALRPVAERLGISAAQLAIAWVFHQAGVTSAIVGSRNPRHAVENAEAGDVRLDAETLAELDRIAELGPGSGQVTG